MNYQIRKRNARPRRSALNALLYGSAIGFYTMKILKVIPIKLRRHNGVGSPVGTVNVLVRIKCGFMWLKTRDEMWKAYDDSSIVYEYSHGGYAHDLTSIIKGFAEQLLNGETIEVQPEIVQHGVI